MPVLIYADKKYRTLAGNKVYDGSQWVTMGGDSKIYLDGKWYDFLRQKAELPDVPDEPEIPDWDDFTHLATEEPTDGNVYYMTPTGAGALDGSSWDNAWSASQIYVAILTLASGDRLYVAEGDYGTLQVPLQTSETVAVYGGFIEGDYSWETRDSVKHPTAWFGNGTVPFVSVSNGIELDGLTLTNFLNTASRVTGTNLTAIHCSFDSVSDENAANCQFTNCRFSGNGDDKVICATASKCYFIGENGNLLPIYVGNLTDSIVVRCCAAFVEQLDMFGNLFCYAELCRYDTNNKFYSVDVTSHILNGNECFGYISSKSSTDSVFIRCKASTIAGDADGITLLNSEGAMRSAADPKKQSYISNCDLHYGIGESCTLRLATIVNSNIEPACSFDNCTVIDCTGGKLSQIVYSTVINSAIEVRNISTSLVVNCTLGTISAVEGTTIVNSIAEVSTALSTVFWNNNGTIPAAGNAQTAYDVDNVLTLGADNTIARFVNTGYSPAIGIQDVGKCPDPVKAPDDFSDYIASFGDWHPLSDSYLIGKGKFNNNFKSDLDSVTRPDPPTIGCYEPVTKE